MILHTLTGDIMEHGIKENGKENYSNRVGTINEELKGKGKIGELKKKKERLFLGYLFVTRSKKYLLWEEGKKLM